MYSGIPLTQTSVRLLLSKVNGPLYREAATVPKGFSDVMTVLMCVHPSVAGEF